MNVNLIKCTSAIGKYRITGENKYNFDEKEFIIGGGITVKRVMTLQEMRSRKIIEASKDVNRQ